MMVLVNLLTICNLGALLLSTASATRGVIVNTEGFQVQTRAGFQVRQASENGTCPFNPFTCPLDAICCPYRCCSTNTPNCVLSEAGCVDEIGRGRCKLRNGTVVLATWCTYDSCCPDPVYNRCAKDFTVGCVNEEGFYNCGGAPGVRCNATGESYCCRNPKRCCKNPADGCCDAAEGTGGPVELAPLLEFSPGVSPSETDVPPNVTPLSTPEMTTEPESPGTPQPSPSSNAPDSTVPPQTSIPSADVNTCFPENATVELEDGSQVTMKQLRTGDSVRVSSGEFSEVFFWTHRDFIYQGRNYITIRGVGGHSVTAATGHLIYACKGMRLDCTREVAQIEDLNIGDGIWVVGDESEHPVAVEEKIRVASKGLFNPQTLHGDIVVDGVLSTCYTKAVHYRAAHSMLAPLRLINSLLSMFFGSSLEVLSGAKSA